MTLTYYRIDNTGPPKVYIACPAHTPQLEALIDFYRTYYPRAEITEAQTTGSCPACEGRGFRPRRQPWWRRLLGE